MAADSIIDLTRGIYRRVYSGFRSGRRINAVSIGAEAWFWRLLMIADDYGNFAAEPELVWGEASGRRRVTLEQSESWIKELADMNLVRLYTVTGDRYGSIVGFDETQVPPRNGRKVKRVPFALVAPTCTQTPPKSPTVPDAGYGNGIGIGSSALEEGNGEKPNGHARPHLASAIRGLSGRFSLEAIDAVANAYPPLRLGSPDRARRAIDAAMEAAADSGNPDPPGFILGQTLAFAQSWAGTRGQYTEKAATWFVDGGWKADPATWARPEEAADKPKRDIKAILRKAHANGQA